MTAATEPAAAPTWVLGARGLLGAAVVREHRRVGRSVRTSRVPWTDEDAAVATLLAEAATLPRTGWRLAWCAGAGVTASDAEVLAAELRVVERFLAGWRPGPGAAFLASSAGVYAGAPGRPPYDEGTPVSPRSPYGRAKLRAEELFAAHAQRTGSGLLVGRIANLYGPGQDVGKGQGLISMMCHSLVAHEQMSIYVSLDTLRDYLYVDDAGAMVREGLDAVAQRGGVHTKILASGTSLSIAEVLGEVTRLGRRRPPVVLGESAAARHQVRDLRLRSRAWPDLDHLARTPVPVGVAACLADAEARVRGGIGGERREDR